MSSQIYYGYIDYTDEGIPFYVGKGNLGRVKALVRNKKHRHIMNTYGQHREVMFASSDEIAVFQWEIATILDLHTFVKDPLATYYACNMTKGGEGPSGHVHSSEAREKIRRASTGRILSNKSRQKIINALIGHDVSCESRQKMSIAQKNRIFKRGHKLSEAHRQQISMTLRGNQNHLGHKHSEETRQKMRLAWEKRKQRQCKVSK